MAEKVIVKGGGTLDGAQFDNAATEATLKRLVALLEKQKTGSGASVSNMASQAKSQGISPKVITETETKLAGVSTASTALSKTGKVASSILSSFGSTISFLASGPLALLGTAFSMFTDTISRSMDALRETGSVGAGFNGSLLELNKAAASAGMSLVEYSKFVKENAQTMANLGGTVTDGARRMGVLSKELRTSEVGQQMMALGVSADTMTGVMADYVKIETQQGRVRGKTNADLTKGSGDYLKQLGELARLTGQTVEQTSKNIVAMQKDEIYNAIMLDMSAEQQKKFAQQMELINSASPEFVKLLKDGITGLGDNDAWNQLASISPEVGKLAESMKNGSATQEQINRVMTNLGPEIQAKLKDMPLASRKAFEPFLKLGPIATDLIQNTEKFSKDAQDRAKKEGDASGAFTKIIMNVESALSAFWGDIKTNFLESGVFEGLDNVFKDIMKTLKPFGDEIKTFLTTGIKDFITTLKTDLASGKGIMESLGHSFGNMFDKMTPVVTKLFGDMFTNLMSGFFGKKNESGEGGSSGGSQSTDTGPFEKIKNIISDLFPILKPIQTVLEGISWAFENWGKILFGLVATGGVLALMSPVLAAAGVGLEAILAPIQAVAIAIGAAGVGLGAMFWGFSKAIEAVSTGLKELPDSLRKLGELDGDKLKSAGSGIAAISDPLVKLGAGGLLAALGGNSGLSGVADAMLKFTSIDINSIANLGAPLTSFHKALSLFTGGNEGILASFGSAIGSWIKGDSGLSKFADSFKAFNDVKADNIMNLASGMTKLKTIGDDFSNQANGINTFSDSIKNLNKAITELNKSLSSIASEGKGVFGGGTSNLEVVSKALGGAGVNTGGGPGSNELNILVTELVNINKEIRESSKDLVNVTKGRYSPV